VFGRGAARIGAFADPQEVPDFPGLTEVNGGRKPSKNWSSKLSCFRPIPSPLPGAHPGFMERPTMRSFYCCVPMGPFLKKKMDGER
jgi:hypothetical protein